MDKEQFLRDIQKVDNDSLRIGEANRILQLLDKQHYSNNDNLEIGIGFSLENVLYDGLDGFLYSRCRY